MILTPLGGPALKIVSKSTLVPEGEVTIIVNPYGRVQGLGALRKQTAHIVIASKDTAEYFDEKNNGKETISITTPGEYEVKGVLIGADYAGKGKDRALIFRMDLENVSIGFCLGIEKPEMDRLERVLEGIDVLCIAVGGKGVLDAKQAMDIVAALEPRLVIPMEYKSKSSPVARETIAQFSKEFGTASPETSSKFKLTKKDLPATDRQMLLLE